MLAASQIVARIPGNIESDPPAGSMADSASACDFRLRSICSPDGVAALPLRLALPRARGWRVLGSRCSGRTRTLAAAAGQSVFGVSAFRELSSGGDVPLIGGGGALARFEQSSCPCRVILVERREKKRPARLVPPGLVVSVLPIVPALASQPAQAASAFGSVSRAGRREGTGRRRKAGT